MAGLDPHARPPEGIRATYKNYQKLSPSDIVEDCNVIDFSRSKVFGVSPIHKVSIGVVADVLDLPSDWSGRERTVQAYEIDALPGLHFIPGLLDVASSREILNRLLHRDLADSRHKTNVGLHYHVPYELCGGSENVTRQPLHQDEATGTPDYLSKPKSVSFFSCSPTSCATLKPLDSSIHKELTISQFLNKKLRWMTLGAQYDWTRKVYPPGHHPDFPSDIASAVSTLFPNMRPESAICNLYSPGDTLSLHRDVSEDVDAGLASLSIGCDALFVVGLQPDASSSDIPPAAVLRLRSGDGLYMSGPARFAWHGVPQVIRNTCPQELMSWPSDNPHVEGRQSGLYEDWQGWLAHKRINLNVRQMRP